MLEGGRQGCIMGRENESEKFLCGHSSSGHCCVLYVGDHLQNPEKQICRTFGLKCQRATGIDFLLKCPRLLDIHHADVRHLFQTAVDENTWKHTPELNHINRCVPMQFRCIKFCISVAFNFFPEVQL